MVDDRLFLCRIGEVRFLSVVRKVVLGRDNREYLDIPEVGGKIIASLTKLKSYDLTHVYVHLDMSIGRKVHNM